MKSCEFKTKKDSIVSHFVSRGLIDSEYNILDFNRFKEANNQWSEYAKYNFNTTADLFDIRDGKGLPNENTFKVLDGKNFVPTTVKTVLAPNGKPSILYQSLLEETNDHLRAKQLYDQTKSQEFIDWFGDSKIVDENGEPLITYHAGPNFVDVFKKDPKYFPLDTNSFFFTSVRDYAAKYGEFMYPVFLKGEQIEKLEEIEHASVWEFKRDNADIQFDSLVGEDYGTPHPVYVVFNPTQIKSVFNQGQFSNSPNIYYQLEENSPTQVSGDVYNQLLSFLQAVNPNFRVEVVKDFSVNGAAKLNEFLIELKEGKELVALPEEVAHVFVEALTDQNLKQQMMDSVTYSRMYQKVVFDYAGLQEYRNEDGTVNYGKLKREAAAKLISLYMQDKDAFRYWSGSPTLISRLEQLFDRFIRWIKGLPNPFSHSAQQILQGNVSSVNAELLKSAGTFYSIRDYKKFETLDADLTQYDRIYINLNNTILNYNEWKSPTKGKMFFDSALREELNNYYTKSKLTKLGRELQEKIDIVGANRVTIFTDAPITPELENRLRGLYGNITLVNTGVEKHEVNFDEDGNPIDTLEYTSNMLEWIANESNQYPNGILFFVDNKSTEVFKGTFPNITPQYYSDKAATYTDPEHLRRVEEQNRKQREFTQGVRDEVSKINRNSLLPLVKQSLKIIRTLINKIEKEGNAELSETFKDEYGNLNVPIDRARVISRLLEETDKFEQGLLHFVQTIESVRFFFGMANELDYRSRPESEEKGLRDLAESNDPQEIEKAIKEAATIMRNILSWEEWLKEIYPEIQNTKVIAGVISDFQGELQKSKAKVNDIAVTLLSKNLETEWKQYNLGIQTKVNSNLITPEEGERQKITAQKIADWLYGKGGDVSTFSFFENTLFIGDNVMSALSKKLEITTQVADEKSMNETISLSKDLWEKGERLGMSDVEIGQKITYIDQETYWENGELKSRDVKMFINPYKNLYKYEMEKQKFINAREKWIEAKNNNNITTEFDDYLQAKKDWNTWVEINWHDDLTVEGKHIYENIPGLVDPDFEKALEKQKEIYAEIRELEDQLRFPILTEEAEDSLNDQINSKLRDLRLLRNEYDENGNLKTDEALVIAQKLKLKSTIDRQIYESKVDKRKFLDAIKEQISSISDDGVKQMLLALIDTDNLSDLMNYAKEYAPQLFVDWLERNTRIKFSDDFYERRKELFERLEEVLPDTEEYLEIKEELKQTWADLTNLVSFLRDSDNVLDASDSTPIIQEKVKEYELYIEDLKSLTKDSPLSKEASDILQELSEMQSRESTKYYQEVMYDKLVDFKLIGMSTKTDFVQFINTPEFDKWIRKANKTPEEEAFKQWFDANHLVKKKEGEFYISPTYIWMKIEPTNPEEIEVLPSWKYTSRELKDNATIELEDKSIFVQIKTQKNDRTWDSVARQWLPKSSEFINERWTEIQRSPALFDYLKTLTDYLREIQSETYRDSQIGYKVPSLHKRYTEKGFVNTAWKTFANKVNPQEQGEANATSNVKGMKQRMQGILGIVQDEDLQVKTDYLGKTIQRVFTPFTGYKKPEEVTDDTLLAVIQYAHGLERVKQLSNNLPKLNLLEQVFTQFQPQAQGVKNQNGQQIPAGTNNRLKLLQHIEKTKLYGDFKEFELGKNVDTALLMMRRVTSIGSQSVLNIPNALKNWLQGTLMNLILSGAYNWNNRKSVLKAIGDPKTSYGYFLSQMPLKEKGLDFHIQAFFNPLMEQRFNEVFKRGALGISLQDSNFFLSAKYSEYGPANILLYSHLYHQDVDLNGQKKKLYDVLYLRDGKLAVKEGATINGEPVNMQEIKLKFKTLAEEVLGKQWNQTVAQRYTLWAAVEFFKKFFIPGMRKRFGGSVDMVQGKNSRRINPVLGETEGYYTTAARIGIQFLYKQFYDTEYNPTISPEERARLIQARDEFLLMLASYLIITLGFGFDPDDDDKYKKLKDNSWMENMALLVALNTKRETDSLNPFPWLTMQNSIIPPVANETFNYIKEPFIGFNTVTDIRKLMDATIALGINPEEAYYDRDMPQYFIEEGQSKASHYLEKIVNYDEFLYQQEPEKKIQVITNYSKSK